MRERADHRDHPRRRFRLGACLIALVALVVVPSCAGAAVQVTHGGWTVPAGTGPNPTDALIVQGQNGADDMVVTFDDAGTVDPSDDTVRITSSLAPVQDTDGVGVGPCDPAPGDPDAVVCQLQLLGDDVWILSGEAGDDAITVLGDVPRSSTRLFIFGGLGDDDLRGSAGRDRIYGEDGFGAGDCYDVLDNPTGVDSCNDTIRDGLGDDVVRGEGGSDTVLQPALGTSPGDADDDSVVLGDGSDDIVSYAEREASLPVTIHLPGSGNGSDLEGDTFDSSVDHVVGTPGNDVLYGAASPFTITLEGGPGDDVLRPAYGTAERLVGGSGTDSVRYDNGDYDLDGVVATANGVADDGEVGAGAPDDLAADVEQVYGSAGADTIQGGGGAGCRVAGGAGADVLTAPAAGCILEGGDGSDTLTGGAGADVLRPGASSVGTPDVLTFGGGSDTVDYATGSLIPGVSGISGVQANATSGTTAWCYSLGVGTSASAKKTVAGQQHVDRYVDSPEVIVGTAHADTLCGGGSGTRLEGGAGGDVLFGGAGADALLGGDGADTLNGQAGDDTLDGGLGADTLNGGAGSDVVDGGDGDDPHVRGGGGSDTIRGGAGNDVLDEVPFSAVMAGGAALEDDAGDVLDGGSGTDVIDGNVGDDVLACTSENLADTWTDSGGGNEVLDCGALGAPLTYAAGSGIDRVVGTPFADTISGAATIDGGGGDDVLTAPAGGGTVSGGPGNDTLVGGAGADALDGGPGADSLSGGAGDDTLVGGAGGDVLRGGPGTETVSYEGRGGAVTVTVGGGADDGQAGEGDDVGGDVEVVVGTAFGDRLVLGAGGGTLQGLGGDDTLVGGAGADSLDGGAGVDQVAGGPGDDVLHGGDGNDGLLGGAGADQLWGDAGNDLLDGDVGRDLFAGGAGLDTADYRRRTKPVNVGPGQGAWNDGEKGEGDQVGADVENVFGGSGNDVLTGSNVGNLLRGGAGNDRLVGGAGVDRFFGDAGNDTIDSRDRSPRDRKAKESVDGGAGRDTARSDPKDKLVRIERRR